MPDCPPDPGMIAFIDPEKSMTMTSLGTRLVAVSNLVCRTRPIAVPCTADTTPEGKINFGTLTSIDADTAKSIAFDDSVMFQTHVIGSGEFLRQNACAVPP